MAITITLIDPDQSLSLGPNIINTNFTNIKTAIDEIQVSLILGSTKQLRLTNLVTTLPNNSVEAATLTATATAGIAYSINPGGGAATYSVSFDGKIVGKNITVDGVGADLSTLGEVLVTDISTFNKQASFKKQVNLKDPGAVLLTKSTIVTLSTTNIGAGATAPLDLSTENYVVLDGDNGGVPLAIGPSLPEVKIDTTTLIEGQVLKMQLLKDNVAGVQLYNGTLGSEVFAKILPLGGGYVSLANANKPKFDTGSGNECHITTQWTQISTGVFRLVILETKNMLNV